MSKKNNYFDLPASLSDTELLEIFHEQERPLRLDALLRVTGLPRAARKMLEDQLYALADEGRLVRLQGGLWARADGLRQVRGRYMALRSGAGGFVTPLGDNGQVTGPDIFIHPLQEGDAWHRDMVRVALSPRSHARGKSREGRIVEVLERGCREVPVHVIHVTGRRALCRPADSRMPFDVSVELPGDMERPSGGSLLLVAPEKRLAADLWQARLLQAVGREDDIVVQEDLVKLNHEVPREFPPRVQAEADALPSAPQHADMAGREDVRALPLVTIDGADARDFDDAVQVEARPGGGWLLRVAIADVSHYVRPRSALDTEALARGNSWYFPTSVEPMLPPALCDGLCSLRPDEDRLAMLAEIPFSATGQPGKPRFAAVVMRSAARLTYDQVKACLLDRDGQARAALAAGPRGQEVLDMLETAFGLYRCLREARQRRGSLDFDLPEPEYSFDGKGRLLRVSRRVRHDAHRLIEEFMIAANEAVARHLGGLKADGSVEGAPKEPFLYRVHPQPDPERLESLFDSLEAIDPALVPVKPSATALQGILRDVQGSDREFLVGRLCLRAMPQARYQPENEGHFGLASRAYCHFTSPIRRYADLLVHRALKASLGLYGGALPAGQKLLRVADQLNRRCEREMARRLACMALEGRVGERFRGVVAGVNDFGLFVELSEMPVEGMIRVEDLGDDWYDFDARRQCLVGQRSGLCWSMGQSLEVVLAEVHSGRLEIRLLPTELGVADECRAGGRDGRARLRPVMPNCRISAGAVTATGSAPCAAKARPAGTGIAGGGVPRDGGDADELFLAKTAHGRGGPDPGRQHHPVPPHGTGARQGHLLAVRRGQ